MKCADCKYYHENITGEWGYCRWMETNLPPQLEFMLRGLKRAVNATPPQYEGCQVGEVKL